MKKIELSDVKNLQDYELIRDEWRKTVIETKADAASSSATGCPWPSRAVSPS